MRLTPAATRVRTINSAMFVFIRAYQSTNAIQVRADQRKQQPADRAQNRCYFEDRKLVSSKKIRKRAEALTRSALGEEDRLLPLASQTSLFERNEAQVQANTQSRRTLGCAPVCILRTI